MPLLLALDVDKRQDVVFSYDAEKQVWQVRFEPREQDILPGDDGAGAEPSIGAGYYTGAGQTTSSQKTRVSKRGAR
jgi:hypothetical protein